VNFIGSSSPGKCGEIQRLFNAKAVPSGGTDLGEKPESYSEKNIGAMHEFVRKLSQAKDFQDVVRIQTQFLQLH
jgi:hypothetical protein